MPIILNYSVGNIKLSRLTTVYDLGVRLDTRLFFNNRQNCIII